jgi:hypothetical protein
VFEGDNVVVESLSSLTSSYGSISMWIQTPDFAEARHPIKFGDLYESGETYEIRVTSGDGGNSGTHINWRVYTGSAHVHSPVFEVDLQPEVWYHLTLVKESFNSVEKLYIDGVEQTQNGFSDGGNNPVYWFDDLSNKNMLIGSRWVSEHILI